MIHLSYFPLYIRYALKTGIASLLAYTFSAKLGSPYPVWAVVSAIIAMQLNVADSIQAGIMRILGTGIGGVVGILLLVILPQDHFWAGAAVFFLSVFFGFLAFSNAKLSTNACVAANVVLLMGVSKGIVTVDGACIFGLMRMMDIILGVICAFVISLWLWPNRLMDTLRLDLSLQFNECSRVLDSLTSSMADKQQPFPEEKLESLEGRIRGNHERLIQTKKHESILYKHGHAVMGLQAAAIERSVESLRTIMDALNDYEEKGVDLHMDAELRALADALMGAFRHLGGPSPETPAPDLVRTITQAVAEAEAKLEELRAQKILDTLPLHKVLQLSTCYQAMRQLAESLLLSMQKLQESKSIFRSSL